MPLLCIAIPQPLPHVMFNGGGRTYTLHTLGQTGMFLPFQGPMVWTRVGIPPRAAWRHCANGVTTAAVRGRRGLKLSHL